MPCQKKEEEEEEVEVYSAKHKTTMGFYLHFSLALDP